MKVQYLGLESTTAGGMTVVVRNGIEEIRVRLPFGFTGTREDIGHIVYRDITRQQALRKPLLDVLPLGGEEWDIPDAEPAAKPKPSKAKKE